MNTIRIRNEEYSFWPKLAIKSPLNAYGQLRCRQLDLLLSAARPQYTAWREAIPHEVRSAVLKFPEDRGELLLMAQVWPERFLEIAERAPAWLAVASSYWMHETPRRRERPSDEERERYFRLFYRSPKRETLERAGFGSHLKVRLLGKLPLSECAAGLIFCLKRTLENERAARTLSHFDGINRIVLALAAREPFRRDYHLLRLAEECPLDNGESVDVALGQIEHWLARSGKGGEWPYGGCIRSWATLRRIRQRLRIKLGSLNAIDALHLDAKFREPPFDAEDAKERSGLRIVPLNSKELLEEETALMRIARRPMLTSFRSCMTFSCIGSPSRSEPLS